MPSGKTLVIRTRCKFNQPRRGASTATVRFYIDGLLESSFSRVLQRNEVWEVATVRWPEGLVVEENADPYEAPRRGCSQDAR